MHKDHRQPFLGMLWVHCPRKTRVTLHTHTLTHLSDKRLELQSMEAHYRRPQWTSNSVACFCRNGPDAETLPSTPGQKEQAQHAQHAPEASQQAHNLLEYAWKHVFNICGLPSALRQLPSALVYLLAPEQCLSAMLCLSISWHLPIT